MFGIGETELVIIVVFAFLLFGPDKLPGMGRTLGRVLRQFREASDGITEVVQTNIMDPASEELEKSPKQRRREELEAKRSEDADLEATDAAQVEESPAPRRETFAERKARLKAERKAAEAAGAAQATELPEDEPESASGADSDEDLPEEAAPARTTAADLYAMPSRRSERLHASDEGVLPDAAEATAQAAGPATSVRTQHAQGEEDGGASA